MLSLASCAGTSAAFLPELPAQIDAGISTVDASTAPACDANTTCITTFPFHEAADTSSSKLTTLDHYSCAPTTDESGPERIYEVRPTQDGFLSATVNADDGVDVDVHILSKLDASACLDRGDVQARADVKAGSTWVVVDTYAKSGKAKSGKFTVDIGFVAPSRGACALESGEMPRVNDSGDHLKLPAVGPIVVEAHLVTRDEPAPYPASMTDKLIDHYALSQKTTGLVMTREQVWAPLEGGKFYGAGIGDPKVFPVVDEGWYVNMYWTAAARPAAGTRMLLRDAKNGPRAVVVSAGYETGPGDLRHIAGTPEETHFYMHTKHLDSMKVGVASDKTLPLGPRVCED